MSAPLTELLSAWRSGDVGARDRLVVALYPHLRAVAGNELAKERRNHTLQPTALVHEVFLRLGGVERIDWRDRTHFVRVAARLMREILVDHARRRAADKRDGGIRVTLSDLELPDTDPDAGIDMVGLDRVLARLEQIDAAKGQVVELRYFGGLTVEEIADLMDMSPATVKRHWHAARVWLHGALAEVAPPT